MNYQPKGGMCANCKHKKDNCSQLDFMNMPVIQKVCQVVVVRCIKFKMESDR